MSSLLSKDEDLTKSAPAVGARILGMLKKSEDMRVSIFDVVRELRKTNRVSVRGVYYAAVFLYALGLVDFDEPYLVGHVAD